jgi:Uma2 family endonuclease
MATVTSPNETYTPEQYLDLEVESDIRNEYRDGIIVPMTGGTPEHNKIASALNALLWFSVREQPYSVFVTDQRLWIPAVNLYTYPDVMVIADPVELKPGRKDTVTNPLLLAEILSESTKNYDRGEKFEAYRTIATFQEYLLIDQKRPYVEHSVKQAEDQWLMTEYRSLNDRIQLISVPAELNLKDLYAGVMATNG